MFFKNILILLILSSVVAAQSFTIEVDELSKSDTLGAEIVFYFTVTNISANPVTMFYKKIENISPQNWESSICTNFCFSSAVDSVATNVDFNDQPIPPNEEREVSFHVFTDTENSTGEYLFIAGDLRSPNNDKVFELKASAGVVSVNETSATKDFKLFQNYPNPFNPTTNVGFNLKYSSNVKISVYDVLGNVIKVLFEGEKPSGNHNILFNATGLSSGIYFYKIETDYFSATKKMILEK